jgi:alkylation response protein AidB-like acyl-CoA dehydrogenase
MREPIILPRVGRALEGHVPPTSSLSPRLAFEGLSPVVRGLVRYERRDPWDRDTELLPKPLAQYRQFARAFAVRHIKPRELSADLEPHPPVGECSRANFELLRVAGREGFLSDLLPRPLGSMHPRLLSFPLGLPQVLKAEEFAAVDGGLMLLVCAHDLGVAPLILSGEMRTIRRHLLPAFRASKRGEPHLFAYAITEPAAGSDVEHGHGAAAVRRPGVVARQEPRGGYRIRGRKCFISGGDIAKGVVVFAALEGEGVESWTAFLVPRGAPGFRVARTELKMGMRASGAAELELDDVFVSEDAVVGGLRNGWALNRATLNLSRIPVAAMAVGFARAATEEATRFACRFRLAGKPLVCFQEVQLALAQMIAETSAARSMVWQIAARRQARQAEASAAKFYCSDAARHVCEMAMDLMSNHAVLHGNRVEKAFRDARLTQIFEGTNQINRLGVIEDDQERLLEAIEAARPGRKASAR